MHLLFSTINFSASSLNNKQPYKCGRHWFLVSETPFREAAQCPNKWMSCDLFCPFETRLLAVAGVVWIFFFSSLYVLDWGKHLMRINATQIHKKHTHILTSLFADSIESLFNSDSLAEKKLQSAVSAVKQACTSTFISFPSMLSNIQTIRWLPMYY